jgi:hypothetical protein
LLLPPRLPLQQLWLPGLLDVVAVEAVAVIVAEAVVEFDLLL